MRSSTLNDDWGIAARHRDELEHARWRRRSRSRDARTTIVRGAVLCLIFGALVSVGWFIQEPKAIAALKHRTGIDLNGLWQPKPVTPKVGKIGKERPGVIVLELPDGTKCRYIHFDNITGWMSADSITECEDVSPNHPLGARREFVWGGG